MKTKRYFGKSRQEILARVRKEHGENFYILKVRDVVKKSFLLFETKGYELVIALPDEFLARKA